MSSHNFPDRALACLLLIMMLLFAACAPAAPAQPEPAAPEPAAPEPAAPEPEAPAEPEPEAPAEPEVEEPEVEEPEETAPAEVGQDVDELILAVTAEPTNYMPGFAGWNEVNSVGSRNIYEFLVTRDPETHELVGELATDWERVEPDLWRFTLREGVTFHDGSEFDAEVAAFAINYLFDEGNEPNQTLHMASQITAEAVDQYTLHVMTEEPDPTVPNRLFFVPMTPMHVLEEGQEPYARDPIGSGPYRLAEWRSGQFVRLEANPDWWGHDDPEAARGEVTFPAATFYFRPETTVRMTMVQAGEADFAMNVSPDMCRQLDQGQGTRCLTAPGVSTIFVRMDALNPMMGDQRVREAIVLAVDMDQIVDTILEGTASRASQIVGPAATGHNPDLAPYGYDPERARQLLDEAQADGVTLEQIEIAYQEERFPAIREFAQAMQAMLQDVGLQVTVTELERSVFGAQFGPGDYPPNRIVIHTHGNASGDAEISVEQYYRCDGAGSWMCDPTVDEMFEEAVVMEGEERHEAFQEIFAYAHEQFYYDFGGHVVHSYGLSERLNWTPPADHRFLLKTMTLND